MKNLFLRCLSIGVYPHMEENKKLAMQVATFDGMATIITMFFYLFYTFGRGEYALSACFLPGIALMFFGLWLLYKEHNDIGRYILHLTALAQIYVGSDAGGEKSGFEFYYFTSVVIPFVTFTLDERKKGFTMSMISFTVLMTQQLIGTGHIFHPIDVTQTDRIVSIFVVVVFMVAFLSVARWQIDLSQKHIKQQQGELIHNSNLKALGEMAGGIAHEINNPLQALTLQSKALKESIASVQALPQKVVEQFEIVDSTIFRIAKLVKGLKDLTRDDSLDPAGFFVIKEALDDVMSVSSERLKNLGIQLTVTGDTELAVNARMVQVSQVLINLLNNSIDALQGLSEKWISIHIGEIKSCVQIVVMDSGHGIPKHLINKLMQPFFTTKPPGKGTGLGLSISKSIVEKNGGRFYIDTTSKNTSFVIELPAMNEQFGYEIS